MNSLVDIVSLQPAQLIPDDSDTNVKSPACVFQSTVMWNGLKKGYFNYVSRPASKYINHI